jgi:hypothetical protein
MQNTTKALEWVVDAHLEVSRLYRLAIEREIQHTLRIFNGKLRDDVKRMLCRSITEIEVPPYPTPTDRETVASVWNKCPKPNFIKIRKEYTDMVIDTL